MTRDLSSFDGVKDYLYALRNHGSKYGIERMRLLATALGNPHLQVPAIHVAGTNGKGSTCAMLESIYRHSGYRTGLFTSPHLVYLGERVQVNSTILSRDALCAHVRALAPLAEEIARRDPDDHPSFFELLTAIAFLQFAHEAVDIAIYETGLGGRLDSTNVLQPEVCIITSIGLDHCEILGDTIEKIAAEKAGIIKAGVPVVVGVMPAGAEAVIRARAASLGCEVHGVREFLASPHAAQLPPTALEGPHQRHNAAAAFLAVRCIAERFPVPDAAIRVGLAQVRWAGRWDRRVLADRSVIFEAAHNPEGANVLDERLGALVAQLGYRPTIVAGMLGTQRAQALLAVIAKHAREILLVRPNQPRASRFDELVAALPPGFGGAVREARVHELFPRPGVCHAGNSGETVVVTGSIYLIGEVMEALFHNKPAGEEVLQG